MKFLHESTAIAAILVFQFIPICGMDYKNYFSTKVLKQLTTENEFATAIVKGELETAKKAMKKGANVNSMWGQLIKEAVKIDEDTTLNRKIREKTYQNTVENLLQCGLAPHGREMLAPLFTNDTRIMWLALKNGSSANEIISDDNQTILHFAVRDQNTDMVQFLIQKGAKIRAKDKNGNEPIELLFFPTSDTMKIFATLSLAADFYSAANRLPNYENKILDFTSLTQRYLSSDGKSLDDESHDKQTKEQKQLLDRFTSEILQLTHLGEKLFATYLYDWLKKHKYIKLNNRSAHTIAWFYLKLASQATFTDREQFWLNECFAQYETDEAFAKAVNNWIKKRFTDPKQLLSVLRAKNQILEQTRLLAIQKKAALIDIKFSYKNIDKKR